VLQAVPFRRKRASTKIPTLVGPLGFGEGTMLLEPRLIGISVGFDTMGFCNLVNFMMGCESKF